MSNLRINSIKRIHRPKVQGARKKKLAFHSAAERVKNARRKKEKNAYNVLKQKNMQKYFVKFLQSS